MVCLFLNCMWGLVPCWIKIMAEKSRHDHKLLKFGTFRWIFKSRDRVPVYLTCSCVDWCCESREQISLKSRGVGQLQLWLLQRRGSASAEPQPLNKSRPDRTSTEGKSHSSDQCSILWLWLQIIHIPVQTMHSNSLKEREKTNKLRLNLCNINFDWTVSDNETMKPV